MIFIIIWGEGMCTCTWWYVHTTVCIWRFKDTFGELVLSFHLGSKNGTQLARLK